MDMTLYLISLSTFFMILGYYTLPKENDLVAVGFKKLI